jgi:hypothetical protein
MVEDHSLFGMFLWTHIAGPTNPFQACILVVRLDQCVRHQRLHGYHSRSIHTRQLVEYRLSFRRTIPLWSRIFTLGIHDLDVGKVSIVCVCHRGWLSSVSLYLTEQSYG